MIKRKRKFYVPTDEIELRLEHSVGRFYDIQWHFKDEVTEDKFLGIKYKVKLVHEWVTLRKYRYPNINKLSPEKNPFDDYQWPEISVRSDDELAIEKFKALKARIKTYADLDNEYGITKAIEQNEADKIKWNKLQAEANDRVRDLL